VVSFCLIGPDVFSLGSIDDKFGIFIVYAYD
jgi:hypothetical protein